MSSRMNKYYEDDEFVASRVSKNEELYREISKSELDPYEVKSNSTIIGESKAEIDVEKIKKILDTKYNETPKRRSIRLEEQEEKEEEKEITKEYDINVVLEKAREQKEDNYEEERLKKLHDTQFEILKNLQVSKNTSEEEHDKFDDTDTSDDLKSLIDTIAINEKNSSQNTDLDILSDLKGSDDTEVLEGLKEKVSEEEEKEDEHVEEATISDTKMINSFYTSSNALKEKDFEDMDDFKNINQDNIGIKIFIVIISIIFLVGIGFLIKTLFFS